MNSSNINKVFWTVKTLRRMTLAQVSEDTEISPKETSRILNALKKEGCLRTERRKGGSMWIFVQDRPKTKKETMAEQNNELAKQKVLDVLVGKNMTLQEISEATGVSVARLKIAVGDLSKAGKISVEKKVKNLSYWTLGEGEYRRKKREKEESSVLACETVLRAAKMAVMMRESA